MFSRFCSMTICFLVLVSCSSGYDPETSISPFKASEYCIKGSDYYKFDDECEDKSAEFLAFIKEYEPGRYIMTIRDPKGIEIPRTTEFKARIRRKGDLNPGDKLKMRGVFNGTTFSGHAEFYVDSYEIVALTENEISSRESRKFNDQLDLEESRISRAYLHCVDEVMKKYPGTKCDLLMDASGFGKYVDGEIKIEAVCDWVDRPVIIECDAGAYGMRANLTKFEVK